MAPMSAVSSVGGGRVKRTGASWRRRAGSGRSGRGVAGLLLAGELLPLHVAPDLLGHLGGADGRRTHHGFHGVLAALEVDRVATERLLLRHALSAQSRQCGIRRPAPPVRAEGIIAGLRGSASEKYNP